MELTAAAIAGVSLVTAAAAQDERGSFGRVWEAKTFAAAGLTAPLDLYCVSQNTTRGTLRGMHWQEPPYEEAKLVRCSRGAVFDVAVDVRPDSPTYLSWCGYELTP